MIGYNLIWSRHDATSPCLDRLVADRLTYARSPTVHWMPDADRQQGRSSHADRSREWCFRINIFVSFSTIPIYQCIDRHQLCQFSARVLTEASRTLHWQLKPFLLCNIWVRKSAVFQSIIELSDVSEAKVWRHACALIYFLLKTV